MVASNSILCSQQSMISCFNPLHCGAVVASLGASDLPVSADDFVSIPFIAGQWSLPVTYALFFLRSGYVSIPFIAGQWSLRPILLGTELVSRGFNPLHCGAVVASIATIGPIQSLERSFNPLHCGAVVASGVYRRPAGLYCGVSIPFIAGQWSLRRGQ